LRVRSASLGLDGASTRGSTTQTQQLTAPYLSPILPFLVVLNDRTRFTVRGNRPGKPVQLQEYEIKFLCTRAREIFLQQPILLELYVLHFGLFSTLLWAPAPVTIDRRRRAGGILECEKLWL
jgi:hypothetical protein